MRAGWGGENVGFLNIRIRRIASAKVLASFLLASIFVITLWIPPAVAEKQIASPREFSGTLIKQVNGKKHQAQVFAKGDRFRLEYKYAIRTDYGYAAIEIIRMDLSEAWYVLAQQKELLITPLDPDDVLPMQPTLPGERGRSLVGEATAVGRPAQLYEVQTDRHGRMEQQVFHQRQAESVYHRARQAVFVDSRAPGGRTFNYLGTPIVPLERS